MVVRHIFAPFPLHNRCDRYLCSCSNTSPEVRSVELFGSWDNFSTGYRMQRDEHKGHGNWRGCHRFQNITCDGMQPTWSKPRNGALKQGGLYWYYVCSRMHRSFSASPMLTLHNSTSLMTEKNVATRPSRPRCHAHCYPVKWST